MYTRQIGSVTVKILNTKRKIYVQTSHEFTNEVLHSYCMQAYLYTYMFRAWSIRNNPNLKSESALFNYLGIPNLDS